ncbi:hypothetical protein TI10_18155 [Photorhabdus luminescens subsp. luminescens]|uniref:Uncharacterized protein n=1 Tax=Photorhabdus luminescens TaxID=29488 RepID=A0A1G5QSL6_PHOLU|nr:hypothetical protein [Photorhabdus luminescens]KMW72020.1 hypothetical protein TI10_18155 [Photorhabdus luminescens subsp. luminescens]SCZ64845.1 hypothetical protein SAMN02982990_02274 [Photorhabdus luminescens]
MDNMSEFISACRKFKQSIIVLEKNNLNVRYIGDDVDLSKLVDITSNIQLLINKQGHELNTLLSDFPKYINFISADVDAVVNSIKNEINKASPNISEIRDFIVQLMGFLESKDIYLKKCLNDKYRVRDKAKIVRDDTKEYVKDSLRIYNSLKEISNRENRDRLREIRDLMAEKDNLFIKIFNKLLNNQEEKPFSIEVVIQKMNLNTKKFSEEEADGLDSGVIVGIIGIILTIIVPIVYSEAKAYLVALEKIADREKELVYYNSSLVTAYRVNNSTKDLSDACEGINYNYNTVINKLLSDNNNLVTSVNQMKIDFGGNDWSNYVNVYKSKLDGFKGKYTNFLGILYQIVNSQQKEK